MYVCVSAPKGINNQWHDMVGYRQCMIGKTSFMAFSGFQLLYITLSIDKMDGCGLSNAAYHEGLARRLRYHGTGYRRNTKQQQQERSTSVIKVSGQIHSDAFKRRLVFSFTVLKTTFSTVVKRFHY